MNRHLSFFAIAALLILQVAALPQTNKNVKGNDCKSMDVTGKYQPLALKTVDNGIYQKIRSELGYTKGDYDIYQDQRGIVEFLPNNGKEFQFTISSGAFKFPPSTKTFTLGEELKDVKPNGLEVKMFFECSGDHLKYSETYSNGKVVHYDRVFKQNNEFMECKMTLDDLTVTHVFKKVKDSEE